MSSWYNLNETPVTRYFNEFTNWITNILIKIEFGCFFIVGIYMNANINQNVKIVQIPPVYKNIS